MKLMKNITSLLFFVSMVSISYPVNAGNKDTVEYVYLCGNDVGIQMTNSGWVVAKQSLIGEKNVDRMLSIALSLLSTGNPTGYFNESGDFSWCGITNAKQITALGILKQ